MPVGGDSGVTLHVPVEKAFVSQMESPHYPNSLSLESSRTCSVSMGCFQCECASTASASGLALECAVKVCIFVPALFHCVLRQERKWLISTYLTDEGTEIQRGRTDS